MLKVRIYAKDKGCCDSSCELKLGKYCNLFDEKLFGSEDNPTRCGDCHEVIAEDTAVVINRPSFLLEVDSLCYGCRYFVGTNENCSTPNPCFGGNMNTYGGVKP